MGVARCASSAPQSEFRSAMWQRRPSRGCIGRRSKTASRQSLPDRKRSATPRYKPISNGRLRTSAGGRSKGHARRRSGSRRTPARRTGAIWSAKTKAKTRNPTEPRPRGLGCSFDPRPYHVPQRTQPTALYRVEATLRPLWRVTADRRKNRKGLDCLRPNSQPISSSMNSLIRQWWTFGCFILPEG
jgi:hypothetical protein